MPGFDTPQSITDQALMDFAAKAGYLPQSAGGATDQDIAAAVASSPTAQGGGPVPDTSPARSSAASPAPAATSSSVSYQGFLPSQYAKIQNTTDPALRGSFAQIDRDVAPEASAMTGAINSAHNSGVAAAKAGATAERNIEMETGRQADLMKGMIDAHAAEEAKITEQYRAESNQAKADYMAALADFRGSRVDPSALWKQMGKGNQFGMMVSAFVQDFLGARGIHTSAMDTFSKAVQRNIDAQIEGIKQKGEVADGFKNLWQMQREQSASDAEARQRIYGFMLDGAKQAVVSHMAQYKAGLADAQGQAAIAKLDEEFSKNLVDVYKHIDTTTLQRREQAIQIFGERLRASTESARLTEQKREFEAQRAATTPPPDPTSGKLIDPWTGKYAYALKDDLANVKPEDRAKIEQQVQGDLSNAKTLDDAFVHLRELTHKMGPMPTGMYARSRWADTWQKEYDGARQQVGQALARMVDGRVSQQEIEGQLQGIPEKLMLAQYDLEQVIADKQSMVANKFKNSVSPLVTDLPKDDVARGLQGGASQGGLYASKAEADATANPVSPEHREVVAAGYLKQAQDTGNPGQGPAERIDGKVPADVREVDEQFKRDYPEEAKKLNGGSIPTGKDAPVWRMEEGMVGLRDEAKKGGKVGDDARAKLVEMATPYFSNTYGMQGPDPQAVLAAMMLHSLHLADPDKFEDPTKGSRRFQDAHQNEQ